MSFYEKYVGEIGALIKGAMISKDKEALNTFRGLKDAVEKFAKETMAPLTEEDFAAVVAKEVKGYRDQIKYGMESATQRIELLKRYMPTEATALEIAQYVKSILTGETEYALSDMKSIMNHMKEKFDGRADMREVATIVKAALGLSK